MTRDLGAAMPGDAARAPGAEAGAEADRAAAASGSEPPTLDAFLGAPDEQVAAVAPATVFLAPGGTRREAELAGISSEGEEYPRWSQARMNECLTLLFRLGVRHVFLTALRPSPLSESGRFRRRLLPWIERGIAGPEAIADYVRRGWRVRLAGGEGFAELAAARERLYAETPAAARHTLWYVINPTPEAHWDAVLTAACQAQARTRAEVIRALYGEDVPPATLCLSWGKPMLAADILPLILAGEVQCYWSQRPGFALGERTLRHILYDYAYLRRTWTRHKSGRYAGIRTQRWFWEQPRVLGVGRRVGPFWYPEHDSLCAPANLGESVRAGVMQALETTIGGFFRLRAAVARRGRSLAGE